MTKPCSFILKLLGKVMRWTCVLLSAALYLALFVTVPSRVFGQASDRPGASSSSSSRTETSKAASFKGPAEKARQYIDSRISRKRYGSDDYPEYSKVFFRSSGAGDRLSYCEDRWWKKTGKYEEYFLSVSLKDLDPDEVRIRERGKQIHILLNTTNSANRVKNAADDSMSANMAIDVREFSYKEIKELRSQFQVLIRESGGRVSSNIPGLGPKQDSPNGLAVGDEVRSTEAINFGGSVWYGVIVSKSGKRYRVRISRSISPKYVNGKIYTFGGSEFRRPLDPDKAFRF